MKIRTGDNVKVLYGKDAGKIGQIIKVDTRKKMVWVQDINKFKKNVKGDGQTRVSQVVTIIKPLPASKVQIVDNDGKATRVKFEMKDGTKTRVSLKSGKSIETKSANKEEVEAKPKSKSKKKSEDK